MITHQTTRHMSGDVFFMPTKRITDDKRRKDYEPKTDFQKWLKPRLNIGTPEEISTQELHRRLEGKKLNGDRDYTENYIYRIVRGDPDVYPNAARPGWALAFAIGEIVGDAPGALKAAGYPVPTESREVQPGQTIYLWKSDSSGDKSRVKITMTDELMQRLILEADFQQEREKRQ